MAGGPLFIRHVYHTEAALPAVVALSTILLYDHFLTIGDEIRLVWLAPWSKAKALFLFTRYSMLLGVISLCVLRPHCLTRVYLGVLSLLLLFSLGSDMLFLLRVYAIWDQNRNVPYLFALVLLAQTMNIAVFCLFVTQSRDHFSASRSGILQATDTTLILVGWSAQVFFDTVLFILVLVKANKHRLLDGGNSPLLKVCYWDGAGYYLTLLCEHHFIGAPSKSDGGIPKRDVDRSSTTLIGRYFHDSPAVGSIRNLITRIHRGRASSRDPNVFESSDGPDGDRECDCLG
ncbi:hypothetical protein BOTBODRAFT_416385 [Botryobasidium botryosum FD-172 SS1]|uniref:DUF6533 domain-containing protein n=1 Tax=Botryobasidium botryosum (strain FD-172 SS1) TaxID=930990 RepID=A0A067MA67_BOTB1|nr:hypothetical protein BOTBODRAFT_416385 [Botryobasidium botryosum FD-172 SS1]